MTTGGPQVGHGDNELVGIYYGIVTRNLNESAPGGRVWLKFPWLPEGDKDQLFMARLAVPMVGPGFGTYTVPEVGDQVLVVFVNGDIKQPMVMGGAYNEVDTPPEANQGGSNDFRVIKSRSAHRVILDDSSAVKVAVLGRKNQNVMTVGDYAKGGSGPNAYKSPTPGGIMTQPAKGVSVAALAGGAKVQVFCPSGTLKVEAPDIEISGSERVELAAKGSLTVESKAVANSCSSSTSNFQGTATKVGP